MKNNILSPPKKKRHIDIGKIIYIGFLLSVFVVVFCQPVLAADDVWSKAQTIMQDVYGKIVGISTVAAVVTSAVALLLMNFSKSGRTVDESRTWLKRIVITWIILNGLGFIVAYLAPLLSGGQWQPTT